MDFGTLLTQGAEAKIYKGIYKDQTVIFKKRFPKQYRHSELDKKLNVRRMKQEERSLRKSLLAGVPCPSVIASKYDEYLIIMEYIEGITLKKALIDEVSTIKILGSLIGSLIGRLHSARIIHGDLTTSNMLFKNQEEEIVLIDFGLSYVCNVAEDKAVDLYVLERALTSTHPEIADELMTIICSSYVSHFEDGAKEVMSKLADVRLRGRKRDMSG